MKILMPVLHYYPVIGGLETWTQNIAERLSRKAEIFVVTGKVNGQPNKEIKNGVKIIRTSPFFLRNLSYSSFFYIMTALPFIFLKSLFLIKRESIGLLHCQGFLSAFLGYLLSRVSGIPYLVTSQSLSEKKGFLRKLVYRKAETCIGASLAIEEYFKGIGCRNIEVIPNGIDAKRFKNLPKVPHQGFVIVSVARLERVKGIEYLIKAIFHPQFLISNFQLWIIGEGSERKNLENLAQKLGPKEKVRFFGQISNEELPRYLAGADCFVLPSLKEGFGIAILEAMAVGLPVIGTRVGGISDIVKDEETGLLINPESPEEIARAISRIYEQPELKNQLIHSAMARLIRYDWESIAEKVYNIYRRIVL